MEKSFERPDPDALLRKLDAEAARASRARLRVFFGFAPGVGKTFRMLEAARELVDQRVDVVVGAVETHGRYDTEAMLLGLELLPRRRVAYRDRELSEFDLDAALARKPRVLLLDELAHSNAPGSRHARRWQDVVELLDAGIDVYTTLNVQHIESLNDVIAQITQVQVRETVPDSVLERAEELELIDISPEELLARLRDGKVYVPQQAERAAQHFFTPGNLLALRELALRRIADRVDADVRAHRDREGVARTWQTHERILVCVGPAPASARLVRTACRMAAGLRVPWVAAYVESSTLAPLGAHDRRRLDAHLRLSESLGATVVRLGGPRVSAAVLDYARKHNITRIVLGKPTHSRLRDFVRGSLLDDIVRGSGDIEVHVVSGDRTAARAQTSPTEPSLAARSAPGAYAWTVALVALSTGVAWLARAPLSAPDIVMLYLVMIVVVAVRFGRGPSLTASALSLAAYDFFFVPPILTFAVRDERHLLTFATLLGASVFISGLTLRIRRQEYAARDREAHTASLYSLSRELATALDETQAADALARHVADVFHAPAAVIATRPAGPEPIASAGGVVPFDTAERGVAQWALDSGRAAGQGTDTLPGARLTCLPIRSAGAPLGVLALALPSGEVIGVEARHSLDAFTRQAALAIERARLAELAKASALKARAEEMRSSLLSAVSHDLRTPLATILGAATALRGDVQTLPFEERDGLLEAICEETERLDRIVGNLLDMTRLEAGGFQLKREWVPLEEIIGSAVSRLESRLGERAVSVDVPVALPLVHVDPVLFEQVFINLLENAAKYTPGGSPIEIVARGAQGDGIQIDVCDRGPGLPEEGDKVFDKFARGHHPGVAGAGLGLAICRGIVEAHQGAVRAENRVGGGAVFRLTLPASGSAPPVPTELPGPPAADGERA